MLTLDTGTVETYSLDGRLLSETDATGRMTTLTYDPSNHLTLVTGPLGHTLALAWSQNRISSLTLPSSVVLQYAYDGAGNLSTLTWPDTTFRQYWYENADFPHALTGITDENATRYATWAYDPLGRVTSSSHAGGANLTTFAYSAGGAGISQTTVTTTAGMQRNYTRHRPRQRCHSIQLRRT